MNEIFNFHKQLNIAKVATFVFFAIIIISLAVIFFIPKKETPNKKLNTAENVKNENKPFEDKNQLISLTLDKSYGLVQYDSTQDYILELRSDNDLNIFDGSVKDKLSSIVNGEIFVDYGSLFNAIISISIKLKSIS